MPRRHLSLVCALAAAAATMFAAGGRASDDPAATAGPSVRVAPAVVQRGERITVTGRNWRPAAIVDLLIGPPRSEADPVGRARTSAAGSFRRYLRIPRSMPPGRRVLLGCRRECRIKAVRSFRVTR